MRQIQASSRPPKPRLAVLALSILCTACGGAPNFPQLPGEGQDAGKTVVYRDEWGVPHIYAPSVESGMYAMGHAQAQDRPQELLKNLLRGIGESSIFDGEAGVASDLTALMWEHYARGKDALATLDAATRSWLQAYVAGINDWYEEHPRDVPSWWRGRQVDAAMVIALARHFLYSWSIEQGLADLRRAGIFPDLPVRGRGSNQWAVSPSRSGESAAILVGDPHLAWVGLSRFWEFRIHAGELAGSGVTLPGFPSIGLGHNRSLAWSMTTGGPDTADVYELVLEPGGTGRYLYDGEWRPLRSSQAQLQVGDEEQRTIEIQHSHHGPIVAVKNDRAYALKTSYAQETGVLSAWRRLNLAQSCSEAFDALGTLAFFPQNVMLADTSGSICYQRTGRVPRRPSGYDFSRPVDGSTSATEWLGLHPASDLVQVVDPPQGHMQNCNVPPDAMIPNGPFRPEDYPAEVFGDLAYGPRSGWSNARAARAVELLEGDDSVSAQEAIEYVLDVRPYGVERWIDLLRQADAESGQACRSQPECAQGLEELLGWDGELRRDSSPALKYFYWRRQMIEDTEAPAALQGVLEDYMSVVGKPAAPTVIGTVHRTSALRSLARAMGRLKRETGALDARYGDRFRIGRGGESWPVGGGGRFGTLTLRTVNFGRVRPGRVQLGRSGQTATQVTVLSQPIRSWSAVPFGQSDRPRSGHYSDQAAQLFSSRRLKPTWWTPQELAAHAVSRTELAKAPQ